PFRESEDRLHAESQGRQGILPDTQPQAAARQLPATRSLLRHGQVQARLLTLRPPARAAIAPRAGHACTRGPRRSGAVRLDYLARSRSRPGFLAGAWFASRVLAGSATTECSTVYSPGQI